MRSPGRWTLGLIPIVCGAILIAGLAVRQLAAESPSPTTPFAGQVATNPSELREGIIQGIHHHLGLVKANANGRQLTVDSIVVSTDRITLLYHATGITSIDFSQISQNPLYRTEPPTLIVISVAGLALRPMDGATEGPQEGPQGGTRWGYFVAAWTGAPPHHIHVSIKRIEGDLLAQWEVDTDL
jgi:hypothetical protein